MNRYIAFFILGMIPALSGCFEPSCHYEPPAVAQKRLPIRAVVWLFKDATPDSPGSRSASPKDGSPVFESNLTRSESLWRPQLTMKLLSEALAGEMQARLIRSVEVVEGDSVIGEEAKGTRLLVSGTVEEACWSRSRSGGGSYRLKVALSAAVVRRNAPNLQGFWTKTVEIDEPHRGRAAQDMAAMLAKAFGGAAEELGKALEKQPAAEALAQAGE